MPKCSSTAVAAVSPAWVLASPTAQKRLLDPSIRRCMANDTTWLRGMRMACKCTCAKCRQNPIRTLDLDKMLQFGTWELL